MALQNVIQAQIQEVTRSHESRASSYEARVKELTKSFEDQEKKISCQEKGIDKL